MTNKNITKLTPFRTDTVSSLSRRGEHLLAASDPDGEVADLAPLEAYYIVREIGLNQALPVILRLSHEQLQACVDLDCWQRYDFAPDSLDEWLTSFAQGGPDTLAKGFLALDYVVQLLYLSQVITVYDPDTDQVPPEEEGEEKTRAMTPDAFYLLELKTEIKLQIHPFTLLDSLYQYDSTATHQLLSELRVELPTQILEEALRFRNGRLEDIGFAPPEEAAVLFSRPPSCPPSSRPYASGRGRTAKSPGQDGIRLPAVYAGSMTGNSLLQQALSLVTDQDFLAQLEQGITWVINSAIIAYGEKVQGLKQVKDIAGRVRDTISLGLESLLDKQESGCPADESAAAAGALALLDIWSMVDLFRHGFAATLRLQREVEEAMQKPEFKVWYELPETQRSDEPDDRQDRAFVAALLGAHTSQAVVSVPLRSGFNLADAGEVRAFGCLADIAVAQVRLQRLKLKISQGI